MSVPESRVMTFGYDSSLAFSKSRAGIENYARDLLNRLRAVRASPEVCAVICLVATRSCADTVPQAKHRPLVFVAHSLGGIVVKKVGPRHLNGPNVNSHVLFFRLSSSPMRLPTSTEKSVGRRRAYSSWELPTEAPNSHLGASYWPTSSISPALAMESGRTSCKTSKGTRPF